MPIRQFKAMWQCNAVMQPGGQLWNKLNAFSGFSLQFFTAMGNKLGDAIDISKSETITHSLTDRGRC